MKNKDNIKNDWNEFKSGIKNMVNDLKTKGKRKNQIPNLLTLSRIGIACFIPPLALSGNLVMAAILTIISASTDALDGLAARKLNAISEFGKNLDPICDKLFAGILTVPLMAMSPVMALGLGINLVLEAGIAGINLKSKAKGNNPRTSWMGKIKTALLSALLGALYISFSHQFNPLLIPILYGLTTTSQISTFISYYHIDKKKDKEKFKKMYDSQIEQDRLEGIMDSPKLTYEKKKESYTIDDYKKLRERIVNPDQVDENEKNKVYKKDRN